MASMLPLVIRVDDLETETSTYHAFQDSPVQIGRSSLTDLVLDHPVVSQFHGTAEFDAQQTWYTDLGSTNGTALGGAALPAQERTQVERKASLEIGTLRLVLDRTMA